MYQVKASIRNTVIVFVVFIGFLYEAVTPTLASEIFSPLSHVDENYSFKQKIVHCRIRRGMGRCVDPPVMRDGSDAWCPYHLCGPSFMETHNCPKDGKEADHLCEVLHVPENIWICKLARKHQKVNDILKCYGPSCKDTRYACPCKQRRTTLYRLEPISYFTPTCH